MKIYISRIILINMDLDITKVVENYRQNQITEFQQSKKGIFKDIEKYIAEHGGLLNGISALKMMADANGNEGFDIEDHGIFIIVAKAQDYTIKIGKFLATKYSGIAVSSKFDGDFNVLQDKAIIMTIKNTGEKTLKVMPTWRSPALKCVAPMILKIEFLLNLVDNQEGVEKWLETYKNNELLDRIAPFKLIGKMPPSVAGGKPSNVLSKVREWAIENRRIFIGAYAYTMFMTESKKHNYFKPAVMFYEIMSVNPAHDIETLKKILSEAGDAVASAFEVKKNYSDLDYHGNKWSISYNKNKILDIYDISNYCIPFVEKIGPDGLKMILGNYYILLLYFNLGVLTSYQIEAVNKPAAIRLRDRLNAMMMELINERAAYLKRSRKTGIAGPDENNLFDVFQVDCIGNQRNFRREWNIKKWNGKIKKFYQEMS